MIPVPPRMIFLERLVALRLLVVLVWGLGPGTLQAATVLHLSLEDMTRASGVVFHGVVKEVNDRVATSDAGPFRTVVHFEILEVLRGLPQERRTFELEIPGGRGPRLVMRIPGMPKFSVGEEVLLFLEKYSGGYALTGLAQGVYRIDRGEGGILASRDLTGLSLVAPSGSLSSAKAGTGSRVASQSLDALLSRVRTVLAEGH